MNINSIITEWTYRLPKGYPDSEQDYQVLHEVLNEMTNLSENDRKAIVRKASGLYEQEDEESTDTLNTNTESIQTTLNNIGLTGDIITQVINVYTQLSDNEQTEFNKNFRIHSIDSFVNSGWKSFAKFFLVNVGGARGGMGNGEISILLGVKDSMPGGTARHDIVMPGGGEWEVKELKSSKFDPAKEGLASKFELTNKIKDFYQNIVDPISDIGDPFQSLKHLVDPQSADDLKKLIQDVGDESVISTLLNSKVDNYLLIDNHADSVIQELDSILIVHPIHLINPMQGAISRLHKELRNIFKVYIKSPFVFVNTRAWSTKANSSKFGPSLMHNDGFEPGHMKIMVYITPLNDDYGYFIPEGGLINNHPAGTCICFLNSDLEHAAVPGNIYNRICIEVTLMRAFINAPQLNMGAFFGRHALSPEVVYDAVTKIINESTSEDVIK